MRVGVVTFAGTLDSHVVTRALTMAGHETQQVWHTDTDLSGLDALVIAGGSSYGEYLRPGLLAQTTPVIKEIVAKAQAGLPILGIGDGMHILQEAGLLAGGAGLNPDLKYLRRDALVRVTDNTTAWSRDFATGEEIVLPVRSMYAAFAAAPETLAEVRDKQLVVLEFVGAEADAQIAGVKNEAGNVVGLLAHPEFAIEAGFGPDTNERMRSGTDGLRFFAGLK